MIRASAWAGPSTLGGSWQGADSNFGRRIDETLGLGEREGPQTDPFNFKNEKGSQAQGLLEPRQFLQQ